MEKEFKCISCNSNTENTVGFTIFKCPNCSKEEIIRCVHCRKIDALYVCKTCGFEGPN